ncbi:unnamed protein product [Mortierella alpina]
MHPHQPTSLHPYNQPVAEAQELELSRRQHPPRMDEYIDPELVDEVLHDIPEELPSTPGSRRSRSELNSTGSNPIYTSASDRPQAQESRMLLSAIQDSREEYPSPSFQAVKRRIDFTEDLSDAEPEFERTPISHLGALSHRGSNLRRQRIGMDSQEERANRDLGKWTPNTLSTSTHRLEAHGPLLSHAETMSPSRIGRSTPSHIRYTGSSKAFDFELAGSDSVSGPDDMVDEVDQEDDDSPQLPETPSRASHSILVSATPMQLRGSPLAAPTSRSRANPEKAVFEENNYNRVPPIAAAYQFSDEEETQDHEHEGDTIASKGEEERRISLTGRKSVVEALVREQEPSDASVSDDDASPKRRTIRPRRAVVTKKSATDIPDQARRAAPTRSNKPRLAKTKDVIAVTASTAEKSGLESRKRKEPSHERTALTVVPVERKGKPMDQDGPGVRRSNRVTFKPLEYWRNERVILGRSDNTPQPVPVIKGVVRAPPPEPIIARGIKRTRGTAQTLTLSRVKATTRPQKSQTGGVDDGAEADEEDDDHSSDSESSRQQGFTQGIDQQFECIDQATGTIAVRALAESKEAMRFQDVPGGHYQYHRGLEDEDTISSGIVRIPGQGTKPNKNASASSVVYYVIQGTVQVTIYKSTVVLHRGGRFLVPRGNQYMIKNLSRKECLLFFAQSKSSMLAHRQTTGS